MIRPAQQDLLAQYRLAQQQQQPQQSQQAMRTPQHDPLAQYLAAIQQQPQQPMPGTPVQGYQSPEIATASMLPQRPWQKTNPMNFPAPQNTQTPWNPGGQFTNMAQGMAQGFNPQMSMMRQLQQQQPMGMPFGGLNGGMSRTGNILNQMQQMRQAQQMMPPPQVQALGPKPQFNPQQMISDGAENEFRDFKDFNRHVGAAYNDLYKSTRPGYGDPTGDRFSPAVMQAAQAMMGSGGAGGRIAVRDIYNKFFGGQ